MSIRKTSSEKDIKKAYSRLSHVYGIFENFFENKLRKKSLEFLDIQEGDKVLEIGFGTGYNLVELAKSVGDNGKVYGIDITPEMIEISRKRLIKNNLEKRANLVQGNSKKLPFNNNSFNIVYISNVLEILSDKDIKIVLKEIKRVLKPKGKICVIDTSDNENYKTVKFYLWLNKKFPSYTSYPIDVAKFIKYSGLKIIRKDIINIIKFFPMQIVIAKK